MAVIKISDSKSLPPVIKITVGGKSTVHKVSETSITF